VTPAISATGLVKDFGSTRALDCLDLAVRSGEVHGFLGPNGAGKTTTIRTRAQFSVDAPELNQVLARLVELDVRSLTSSPPTLEELFLRHYGDVIETPEPDAELVATR
jgi:ABC-type uncharacterized transport system ATPase subunit